MILSRRSFCTLALGLIAVGSASAADKKTKATPTATATKATSKEKSVNPNIVHVVITVSQGSTLQGTIKLELYKDKAPVTVENFVSYVKDGFYDNTIFHRVISGFMVQGGGFTKDMTQKSTKAPIKLESGNGLLNTRGTVAMARTNVPDSATAQFFINHIDNAFLNASNPGRDGYAVFGQVTEGMDVVDKIAKVTTYTHPIGHQNVPKEPVIIQSIRLAD